MDATREPAQPAGRAPRRTGAVVLAFLLGLLTAAVAGVALAWTGTLDELGLTSASPTPSEEPTASPEPEPQAGGDVPASCVRSAEYNQVFTQALDDIAIGIRDQDARALEEALDAVQDVKPGSEEASADCLAAAGEDGGTADDGEQEEDEEETGDDDATSEPTTSPEPTTTPTP